MVECERWREGELAGVMTAGLCGSMSVSHADQSGDMQLPRAGHPCEFISLRELLFLHQFTFERSASRGNHQLQVERAEVQMRGLTQLELVIIRNSPALTRMS